MISMAPSSFTTGGSVPEATRATALTMGAKRSSMAWTCGIDGGASTRVRGGVTRFGGVGFRFIVRLSHARIAGHGLQALARAGTLSHRAPAVAGGQWSGRLGPDPLEARHAGGSGRISHRVAAEASRR